MSAPHFVPRYFEIEQALRGRIADLRPGDAVPSDADLCEEFGVSRMTARNAMQRLAQEGLVERIPGRGTFVAEQPVHRQAGNLLSFSDEMRRRGRVPSSKVLRRATRPGQARELARLDIAGNVFELVRLRLADGDPIAIETSVFDPALAATLEAADLEAGSLFDALAAAGRIPTAGRGELGAAPAAAEDAQHLRLLEGAPLLIERRLIHDEAGRPLELTESRYAAGRYSLEVAFDVELA
jgi:GntR family transcriptional regulator